MIEYEDFSLKIEPKRGEVYPVIVLHSPAGEGRSSFTLPFNPDEIGDILFDLGWTVRGSEQMPLRDVSPAATSTRPQQIGDQLFSALFSGTVRSLLDHSLGMMYGRQRGLRIKLHIDPEDPSLAQLASLPWEYLYRKEKREFLNLSRFTPIIRYLDVQIPYTPLSLEPPLRILVVISDPADYESLDLDRERELIETSWAKHEGVQVDFMEEATVLTLQDRLINKPYHVLHYMGHGGFDEHRGRGVLLMEDEDGQGAIVDGNTLGILLRDIPTMRLAFLNACETARVTKEKGLDPFSGVAAAMVMAGIPAVVAMQFPVSDRAAITFSQKFYPLLARGEPVDAAVAEGRRAICLANSGTMEWGTPVLFLRASQGVIFQVSEIQREKVPLPEIPELPEEDDQELEQRLTELYTLGLSAFWLEEWEKAIRNFQAIVDVRPEYEDVADKLAEAKRQANLYILYTQAQEAQGVEDWSSALDALEQIMAEVADYKDTRERLQTVKRQKKLADLYTEAQHLHQAQQWQAVVKVFSKIHSIEPEYPDPEGLQPAAEREVAALKRKADLSDLYSFAVREMNAGHWQEARQLLIQVQGIELDFRDTERLLAKVEQEIKREEGLEKEIPDWLQKMEQEHKAELELGDRKELPKEYEETQLQSELAALYADAVRLLEAGQYQKALEKWEEVQARDPHYPDRQNIQSNAEKKLESVTIGATLKKQKRNIPDYVWALFSIIGIIVILTSIYAVSQFSQSGSSHEPFILEHMGNVLSVAFSPDGSTLASGSSFGINVWDARNGERLITLGVGPKSSVAFSPDGTTLASGGYYSASLWDILSGEKLGALEGIIGDVWSVAYSPDGSKLAFASNKIILYDTQNREQLRTLGELDANIYSVVFSPDGTTLASGSNDDVVLWDARNGEKLSTLEGHREAVWSVAYSPDGLILASGAFDGTVILWDTLTGMQLSTLEGHRKAVRSVAFSPDGSTLASGSDDTNVILWDIRNGVKLRTLDRHTNSVQSVAFSPDGLTLATGSNDETVILWDTNTILN